MKKKKKKVSAKWVESGVRVGECKKSESRGRTGRVEMGPSFFGALTEKKTKKKGKKRRVWVELKTNESVYGCSQTASRNAPLSKL